MSRDLREVIDGHIAADYGSSVIITDDLERTYLTLAENYGYAVDCSEENWSTALKRPSIHNALVALAQRNIMYGLVNGRNVDDDMAVTVSGQQIETGLLWCGKEVGELLATLDADNTCATGEGADAQKR